VLGRQLAAMEGAEAGYCCASGMGAIAAALLQLAHSGDHIVASHTIYGGSYALMHDYLPEKVGLRTTFVDVADLAAVAAAFTARTRVLYCETMANPLLTVADIEKLAEFAHGHNAKLVVDNTFCPLIVSPLQHGADVVVYSLTKFINGASDYIAGAICGTTEFITSLMDLHQGSLMLLGPTMDPQAAYNISMRLPHLPLRMIEHSRRAAIFAQRLHELSVPVIYPGLPDHPQHGLLKNLANAEYGFGGILAIDLGSTRRANEFMETLQNKDRFGFMAVSLGYFDTLMSCSASSTSSELPVEELERAGIRPGLVRMSIGYTGTVEQRWQQLSDALGLLNMI
jgi:methionine-gamma-lyase